ncbi:MAG: fused MFS/spermidine synthase [Methylovulum sp.]|nr:fused MFS/spermidine synthase [Methylovulum sp.]MCF7997467.1 fused MFS/spermidine synthase [Methylovulum sp.]
MSAQSDRRFSLIFLFASTLFVSALLMFILQPLFGKILLPLLGGSPAVWNTCMVFYQSLLFLGYWYAHSLTQGLAQRWQIPLHLSIIVLSFFALPLALPEQTTPPTDSNPSLWLLGMLSLSIGLPFFVLSTTSPLLQKWFAQMGHATSHDPYYLYATSNTGSLIALLSYPFILEPTLGLALQKTYWSIGYGILCVLIGVCAWMLSKNQPIDYIEQQNKTQVEIPSVYTQLHWLFLAFVPSSLLLGLTNFISTDIASVPLLWIIPLTVYLLSFIIVFSKWNLRLHPLFIRLQAFFLVPFMIYAFINPADLPYWVYLILHVIAFFFAIMVCHGELAKKRPHTQYLTRFYLIMSFAGMLGGMFNTFLAPFIFNGIYEYPLMIIAALLLRPSPSFTSQKHSLLLLIPSAALLLIALLLYISVDNLLDYFDTILLGLMAVAVINFALRSKPAAYASFAGVIIFLALSVHSLSSHTLYQERTFFGVLAVRESILNNEQNQPESYHELFHGTTKHGAQRLSASLSTTPLTYYSQPGPMGQLFSEFAQYNQDWTIGVVGLGAGALACYSQPKQHWHFYEIDPLVVDIANNPSYFSYMSQCAQHSNMTIADARLSLTKEPDHSFDLLLMDAFSSDAVPTHLLTEEAIKLYFSKLKAHGILAFHITNRHLALKKVLSIHAEHLHLAALIQEFVPEQERPLVVATDWVVMANQPETLELLKNSRLGNWQKMPLYFDMKPWTDDFTNIVSLWK